MKAWELLEQTGWCQYYEARDENGCKCDYSSDKAVKFCIIGALAKTYGMGQYAPRANKLEHILGKPAILWNDTPGRTKAEVIAVLKQADI